MKRTISIFLSVLLLISAVCAVSFSAEEITSPVSFKTMNALYAHAVSASSDTEAWSMWQSAHNEDYVEINKNKKYFFLPSSANADKVDIYNAYTSAVIVNGTEIAAGKSAEVSYKEGENVKVKADGTEYTVEFIKSSAEAAIYVNNSNADKNGTELITYLNSDKSLSAKATGAIVTPDGKIDNTSVKKIKGRGNTTWQKAKKPYNITYNDNVSIAGMSKGKKFSLLANYQDDSLSRNRFLYDLSDAVGMPYASDSRYVDFYANGYYWGSYQICEKIEVGKNSLVPDFEEDDYLDKDGNIKEDFPFLCEVDAGAADGEDYYVSVSGQKITIKAPELEKGDKGYDEVKAYVSKKFGDFYSASRSKTEDLSDYADVDSLAKIYIINELGKNWDAGVSSLYLTYKPDENGKYKFYGSPVWDYDNSLGNAVGVANELRSIGVTDYEKYTGWWCKYKGRNGGAKTSSNIMNRFSQNAPLIENAKKIWSEKFVPAVEHFSGTKYSEEIDKEFYTADEYFNLVNKTAEMNYTSGWLLNTGSWIADHSKMASAFFDNVNKVYSYNKYPTAYNNDFKGMFDYARDWLINRAAWLSKEWSDKTVTEQEIDNGGPEKEKQPALSASSISLKAGVSKKLTVKDGTVKGWKSSSPKTVKVKNGKVTALKKGKATITVSLTSGEPLKCTVNVTTSPKLGKKTLTIKKNGVKTVKIKGKAKGVNNKYKNTKHAKITSKKSSSTLKVKGLKKGKTTLTITVNGVKLKLKVKVK